MKKTRLLFLWLLTLPAVLALPGPAFALDAGATYDVYARIEHATHWMGTWRFLPRDTPVADVCRYHVEWISSATMPLSAEFYVDEQKTPSHTSCAENARKSFSTILTLAPAQPSMGFDRFDQMVSLRNLTLRDDGYRGLAGTIQGVDGLPYAITAQPTPGVHHSADMGAEGAL